MSPMPATPTTSDEAMSGTTIISSDRRNSVPTGSVRLAMSQVTRGSEPPQIAFAASPAPTPTPRPIRIRV